MSVGSYDDMLAAVLGGSWAANTADTGATTLSWEGPTTSGKTYGQFTRAAGSFVTDGFVAGKTFTASGFSAAVDGIYIALAVTATTITVHKGVVAFRTEAVPLVIRVSLRPMKNQGIAVLTSAITAMETQGIFRMPKGWRIRFMIKMIKSNPKADLKKAMAQGPYSSRSSLTKRKDPPQMRLRENKTR